jgi:transposase-like protein
MNADAHRKMIDVEVAPSEDAGTLTLLRSLAARGLAGVDLVAPDDDVALVSSIAAVLPGFRWQRCRTSSSTCSPGCRSR